MHARAWKYNETSSSHSMIKTDYDSKNSGFQRGLDTAQEHITFCTCPTTILKQLCWTNVKSSSLHPFLYSRKSHLLLMDIWYPPTNLAQHYKLFWKDPLVDPVSKQSKISSYSVDKWYCDIKLSILLRILNSCNNFQLVWMLFCHVATNVLHAKEVDYALFSLNKTFALRLFTTVFEPKRCKKWHFRVIFCRIAVWCQEPQRLQKCLVRTKTTSGFIIFGYFNIFIVVSLTDR